MDIRKFFGVVSTGKKNECEAAKKTEKTKNGEGTSAGKKKRKETKVKNSSNEDDTPKKQTKKKKRIIYDSDSEEETQSVKKSKKLPERKQSSSKPDTVLKQDPVVYISETDEEDDFVKKTCLKLKENGVSARSCQGTAGVRKEDAKPQAKSKPLSPVKRTPTSALDYFGTGSVQRSEKILVSSKRKEPSQGRDSTLEDEAIAKILQLEEDAELERQLHEDEEFARTLAMLDETPKEKKARNNPEEKPTTLVTKMSPNTADKHKQSQKVKIANSIDDGVNYSKKEQTKSESMRESCSRPEPSVDKTMNKTLPLKPSSKLVALKQKEENKKKERESLSVARERKTSEKEEKATPKKERVSPQKPESVSPEDSEKKRVNYQAYRSFLNREGPKALGSKEIPQGGENCLEGLTFVITGVLESIERDEAKSLIERYGGKVTGSVSKKTNYLVMGRDCGQSKCDKASALGTKIIDEDGLFDLIQTMPGKKSKYELAAEAEVNKAKSQGERTPQKAGAAKRKNSSTKKETDSKKKKSTPGKGGNLKAFKKETPEVRKVLDFTQQAAERKHAAKAEETSISEISTGGTEGLLWVDKYKPTSIKTIIGQQGEQSCANKLLRWLRNWHKNTSEDKHARPSKFGGRDDGTNFKAALLSGPPGVGKTTTAVLVCEELGYSYVELNASDTRSKNSLKEVVAESLNNTSIKDFCSGTSPSVSTKHVLIMDEVDGMAGNEDRGGIQELIGLIKLTKIPIICMCNDRNHPKIRSLVHYCFDLRFQRPRVEQIKGAMMSVAYKEGLKIPPPAMNEIIMAANQDIRQVLHNLSMWCAKDKSLTYDKAKADSSKAKKDIKLGPFDVVRKVFATGEETAHMSLIDKSDLFFHDYSLAPLFVQENYVHVKPVAAGNNLKKHLMLLSRAADSICDGDLVDTQIRRKQNWSLLPTQAIYASVLPGELMRGYMSQFPNFPSWLGKLSSTGKHERIIQELAMHMSLRTNTCKRTVNMEYLSHLRDAIVRPLTSLGVEGVPNAVTFMDSYCLMKDDVENIMEISSWGGKPSPFSKLDPKVKAAFTRTYNKEAHLTPYALHVVKTSKRRAGSTLTSELNEELNADELQSEEEQDSIENDAMIKQKKAKSSKVSKAEKSEEPKMEGKRKAKMRR